MQWFDWHTVTERLQGRAYALTRGQPYRVILDPTTQTGSCNFTDRTIRINPDIFTDTFQRHGLSGDTLAQAGFLVSRAITGHESLHVLYTDPGPVIEAAMESPLLKMVLNLLEDARIERIGSEASHVTKTLFEFLNGVAAGELEPFEEGVLRDKMRYLDLLLRWRLGTAIPKLTATALGTWEAIRTLADQALVSSGCGDVLTLSREIVKVIGVGKRPDEPVPDTSNGVMGRMQSDVGGARTAPALPNPLKSKAGDLPEYVTRVTGTEGEEPDLSKLVEDTGRKISEDLGALLPDQSDGAMIARATRPRAGQNWDIVASPYQHYLPEAEAIAAEIVRELKAEAPRAATGPSVSAGRFRTRYFIRDPERPFAQERFRGIATPEMAITLVIDRSGSMESVVNELRVMAMALTLASERLEIPLSIWALEGQVHVKRFDEHGPQVLAKIAGIQADTLTRMMPTIRDAVKEMSSRPEELKQIILLHDGMPADRAAFIQWRKELRCAGLFCMFIAEEADDLSHDGKEFLRGRLDELVGPRSFCIAPVTGIAKHWCSFIRNKRRSHSSILH